MTYILDTNSLSELKHYYPNVFKSVWSGIDGLVANGELFSVKEVFRELKNGTPNPIVDSWIKANRHIFKTPGKDEFEFVAEIFKVPHFQNLIGEKQRLKGTPVADPFVIASAKINEGIVVTEEKFKDNAAKIPNVCNHFGIECIDLERLMIKEGWSF